MPKPNPEIQVPDLTHREIIDNRTLLERVIQAEAFDLTDNFAFLGQYGGFRLGLGFPPDLHRMFMPSGLYVDETTVETWVPVWNPGAPRPLTPANFHNVLVNPHDMRLINLSLTGDRIVNKKGEISLDAEHLPGAVTPTIYLADLGAKPGQSFFLMTLDHRLRIGRRIASPDYGVIFDQNKTVIKVANLKTARDFAKARKENQTS